MQNDSANCWEQSAKDVLPVRTMAVLLICLLVGFTGWAITAHNPLSRSLALHSIVFGTLFYCCRRFRTRLPRRAQSVVIALGIITLLIHCIKADVPITGVGLQVMDTGVAAEVSVVLAHKQDTEDPVPAWVSPRHRLNDLHFLLRQPIYRNQRTLKFRFTRTNEPYQIKQVSYATDFFHLPFKIAVFDGDDIKQAAHVNPTNNQLERNNTQNAVLYALTNKIRSKPVLLISASEGFVRQQVISARENLARLIWFFIHLAVILTSWKWTQIRSLFGIDRKVDDTRAD